MCPLQRILPTKKCAATERKNCDLNIHELNKIMGRVSWLNLHLYIPQRDVRKIIYALLSKCDRIIVQCAHSSSLTLTDKVCKDMLKNCAANGYLELFCWIEDQTNCTIRVTYMYDAVHGGHKDMVEYIISSRQIVLKSFYTHLASKSGYLDVLQLLYDRGCDWFENDIAYNAAINGHIHILNWLRSIGWSVSSLDLGRVLDIQKTCTHVSVLKWFSNNEPKNCI